MTSLKNKIYYISIINWENHNPKANKLFKKSLISNNFLMDPKIRTLTPTGKLLFLCLLLVSGESASSQIEVTLESLCFQSGVKPGSIHSQLDQLQSLQLLTWSKNASLIKEKKEKEKKESPPENLSNKDYKKAENFNNVLNSSAFQNVLLTKHCEVEQFFEKINHDLAFGSCPPVGFSKMRDRFLATLVSVYDGSTVDFVAHLNAIISEEGVKERSGVARTDYLFTRIKNKALEFHNAKQS